MGQFSWLDCKTEELIIGGKRRRDWSLRVHQGDTPSTS